MEEDRYAEARALGTALGEAASQLNGEANTTMLRLMLHSAEERAATWERVANAERRRAEDAEVRADELNVRLDHAARQIHDLTA